jgi:glycosyltransferase involved in cell wall biosynthesis
MISVITPTNNSEYIKDLHFSIDNQTLQEWEWIILCNGNKEIFHDLKHLSEKDSRIKVHFTEITGNVGKLKKHACSLCKGDYIVEADHDDILVDTCLEKVNDAFVNNPRVGFVYSDNAKLADEFNPYNPVHGWTYKKFKWGSKELYSMNSLPLTPGNVTHIWWSPDHVRAWRKSTYDFIGGHDETLEVCDDNDLMCRLYLVTEFYYIPEVLYVYRIRDDKNNTWLKRNADIQRMTVEIHEKYIERIALKWCERNNLLAIDLCGGHNSPKEYISVDLQNSMITADLDGKWPFGDEKVGLIRAFDAIEHLRDPQNTMKEVYRVLAPGGVFYSRTPSTDGRGAFQDPTHVSFWNENSFLYWTDPNVSKYINNYDLFRKLQLKTFFPSDYFKNLNISYVKAVLDKVPYSLSGSHYK